MTDAPTLRAGARPLLHYPVDGIDATALLLFPEAASGPLLETTAGQARARLELPSELASTLGSRASLLDPPELALTQPGSSHLNLELERGPLGLVTRFPHLHIDRILSHTELPKAQLVALLTLLYLHAGLRDLAEDTPLQLDLQPIWSDDLLQHLREQRLDPTRISEAAATLASTLAALPTEDEPEHAEVWRDPEHAARHLLPQHPEPETTAALLARSFALPRTAPWEKPRDWRVSATRIANDHLDSGHLRAGLALLYSACDVDHPSAEHIARLRKLLRNLYGRPLAPHGFEPRFLLDGSSTAPVRDLARLFHDATAGAVFESTLPEGARREVFFAEHIASAMGYLDADPTPEGGRVKRRHRPTPPDAPGLGVVVLFLIGLAFALLFIGVILSR